VIRIKNLLIVIFAITLSMLLAIASFGAEYSEAYLFPRIITSIMMLLSLLLLIFHFYEKNYQSESINIAKLSPILILFIFFIFAGEYLGFYFSTSIIFLSICFFYFPQKKDIKKLLYFLLVGTSFMATIYFLFSFFLKVQVPRFFLF
jgi:energy-converting hydrogenase Eha subunit G